MRPEPDMDTIVRSWLEPGATRLPDRVLDSVLDQLPAYRQHRSRWPVRRLPTMFTPFRLAVAAAAIVALAAGAAMILRPSGTGGPDASPSPVATPTVLDNSDAGTVLVAGRYRVEGDFDVPFTITFPTPWRLQSVLPGVADFRRFTTGTEIPWLNILLVEDVFIEPCDTGAGFVTPRPRTVDEYSTALTSMVGFPAGPIADVEIDGRVGKAFELNNTIDTATAGCSEGGFLPFLTFRGSDPIGAATNGQVKDLFWIVDVEGNMVVINSLAGDMSPATRAELEGVVLSMDFD